LICILIYLVLFVCFVVHLKCTFRLIEGSLAAAYATILQDCEPLNDVQLYLPPDYYEYSEWPLVVYLHGAGSRGQDLELVRRECLAGQILQGKPFDFLLLASQCPDHSAWSPELVVGLIEQITSSFSIDRDRVYLTGLSMGGLGTWATAIHDPARFAAIAPLCGGGNPEQAEQLKNMPVWAFHGDKDTVVPFRATQAMVEAVRKCGGQVAFTAYPGAGHGISEMTYQNTQFFEWLLAQRRRPVVTANQSKQGP
jgi:predicted peptidase